MSKWYSFNFNISWDKRHKPKTWVDIFIIDRIVRDVISKKKIEIELWGIHRRWDDKDKHGHELTFRCFTNEETASWIEEFINENKFYKVLLTNKLIVGGPKILKNENGTNIRDIADDKSTRRWPDELKDSWPYYINGCCEMFLGLIESLNGGIQKDINEKDISKIESFYTELNNRISEIWQKHGSHAFFHHINAIFGYVPLLANPRAFHGILASF